MRIGIIRESMVYPPGSKAEEPIVTAVAAEINRGLLRLLDERGVPDLRALRGTAARPGEVRRQPMTEALLSRTA